MISRYRRMTVGLVLIAAVSGATIPVTSDANNMKLDGDAAAVILIAPVVAGILGYMAAKAIVKAARSSRDKSTAPQTGKPPPSTTPAVTDEDENSPQREFLRRPLCRDVGGYEAYLKRTNKLCRLY